MSEIDDLLDIVQKWLDGTCPYYPNHVEIYPALLEEIHRLRYRLERVKALKPVAHTYGMFLYAPEVAHILNGLDACEVCGGAKGGEPGNENRVPFGDSYLVMCDYCHAERMNLEGAST